MTDQRETAGLLRRELGVTGATLLGLGSMLGTGIFVSLGLAAGVAGSAVVPALVLAAALAACNALSSAQLAAAHPVSGGTYEYGHRLLGPWLGFTAGWLFLCAKTASAATAALGAAGYLAHLAGIRADGWLGAGGAAMTIIMTALVCGGLRRSTRVNVAIVSLTVLALGALVVAGFWQSAAFAAGTVTSARTGPLTGGVRPFLYATALMFVAYTGYARIATLGEEVQQPSRTIPRAIVVTLLISGGLYVLVALAALGAVTPDVLAESARHGANPLEAAALAMGVPGLPGIVAIGAVTAMLGVLLNLILGLSRVVLAMGRRSDLPQRLAHVDGRGVPRPAVLATGIVVAASAALGRVEVTWAFSALTVLIYYAITNLAALRLPPQQRRYPSAVAWAGLAGCLGLAAFVPIRVWLSGLLVIAAGLIWRVLASRFGGAGRSRG